MEPVFAKAPRTEPRGGVAHESLALQRWLELPLQQAKLAGGWNRLPEMTRVCETERVGLPELAPSVRPLDEHRPWCCLKSVVNIVKQDRTRVDLKKTMNVGILDCLVSHHDFWDCTWVCFGVVLGLVRCSCMPLCETTFEEFEGPGSCGRMAPLHHLKKG